MKTGFKIWIVITLCLIAFDAYLIAFYAPIELYQGAAQKIFYWHVPSAMVMMSFFLAGGILSAVYVAKHSERVDRLALSFIEVGLLFATIVLVTGPIWAKPIWGVWWTWEPRLTSTLLVWVIFVGYFMLRKNVENIEHARLYSAVLAIFGCLDLPIIFLAVRLWRGVHPQIIGREGSLPPSMSITLIASMVAVFNLAILLVSLKARRLKNKIPGTI